MKEKTPKELAEIVREGFYTGQANYWDYKTEGAEEALRELVERATARDVEQFYEEHPGIARLHGRRK